MFSIEQIVDFMLYFNYIRQKDCFKSQFQNVPFCPISASGSNFNPRNTTCIPVVKIFAFLDLEQISVDFEIEHFETGS